MKKKKRSAPHLAAEEVVEDLVLNRAGHSALISTDGFDALCFKMAGTALGGRFGIGQTTITLLGQAKARHIDLEFGVLTNLKLEDFFGLNVI